MVCFSRCCCKRSYIRNEKELFDCEKTLPAVEDKMNGKMMNWVFISAMEMKKYRGEFHEKCKQIIGIRKLHQVLTKPDRKGIYLCRFACVCSNCICGNVKLVTFQKKTQHLKLQRWSNNRMAQLWKSRADQLWQHNWFWWR